MVALREREENCCGVCFVFGMERVVCRVVDGSVAALLKFFLFVGEKR